MGGHKVFSRDYFKSRIGVTLEKKPTTPTLQISHLNHLNVTNV